MVILTVTLTEWQGELKGSERSAALKGSWNQSMRLLAAIADSMILENGKNGKRLDFFFFFNLGENKTILLGKKGQENGEVMKKAGK